MHRWSEAWLGWYLLGLSHSLVHCFGMTALSVAFSSSTNGSFWQFVLAVKRSVNSLTVKTLSPWKLMLRDGLNLYAVSPSPYLYFEYFTSSSFVGHLGSEHRQRPVLVYHQAQRGWR
jgi:hypothetical protein